MLKVYSAEPFKKAYQFEYSLYNQISMLFAATSCRSMTADRLYLYYREGLNIPDSENGIQPTKRSDAAISELLHRDVLGLIDFPMMNECHVEVRIKNRENGLHEFIFTDYIYAFSVSLRMDSKYKKVLGIDLKSRKRCC